MRIFLVILLIGSIVRAGAKEHWSEQYQQANEFFTEHQFDSAFAYYFELGNDQTIQNIPDSVRAESFRKLGILLFQQGQYAKSAEYFKQASEEYSAINDGAKAEKSQSNLANVYVKLKKFDQAETIYLHGLQIALKKQDSIAQLMLLINMSGLYNHTKQFQLAAQSLHKAQYLATVLRDSLRTQMILNNLTTMYLNQYMPDSALQYLHQSASVSSDIMLRKAALKNLSKLHGQMGNTDSALKYNEQYHDLSNSLKNEKIAITIASLESELELEKSKARFSSIISWAVGIVALLMTGLAYWYLKQRHAKQKLRESKKLTQLFIKQLKTFENEKKEVGSSLHTTVLPNLTAVRNLLDMGKAEMVKQPLRESIEILYNLHNTQFYVRRLDHTDWLTYTPTNAKHNAELIKVQCEHDPTIYSNEYQIVVLAILEQLLLDGQQKLSVIPDEYGIEVIYATVIQFSENTQALLSFFGCSVQQHKLHIPLFENK